MQQRALICYLVQLLWSRNGCRHRDDHTAHLLQPGAALPLNRQSTTRGHRQPHAEADALQVWSSRQMCGRCGATPQNGTDEGAGVEKDWNLRHLVANLPPCHCKETSARVTGGFLNAVLKYSRSITFCYSCCYRLGSSFLLLCQISQPLFIPTFVYIYSNCYPIK